MSSILIKFLYKKPYNQKDTIPAHWGTGEVPLVRATLLCHGDSVKSAKQIMCLLLHHGANVDGIKYRHIETGNCLNTSPHKCPLIAAVHGNCIDAIGVLLAAGARLEIRGVLEEAEPELFDATPLHFAAATGNVDIARELIAAGAIIDAIGARYEDFDRDALLWNGDIRPVFSYYTPLVVAVWYERHEIVDLLLAHGANVNTKFRDFEFSYETPLHVACRQLHLDVVQKLIAKDASCKARNSIGETALFGAILCFPSAPLEDPLEEILDVVDELMMAGADINCLNDKGETATFKFLTAVATLSFANDTVVEATAKAARPYWQAFIDRGASLTTISQRLSFAVPPTVAHCAVLLCDEALFTEYCRQGGNVNVYNLAYGTPLQLATEKQRNEFIRALIFDRSLGCCVHAIDAFGKDQRRNIPTVADLPIALVPPLQCLVARTIERRQVPYTILPSIVRELISTHCHSKLVEIS